jgi:magnesium transporter
MYYDSRKKSCTTGTNTDYQVPEGEDFIWILMEKSSEQEIAKVGKDFHIPKKHFLMYSKEKRSARYSVNPLVFVFMDYYLEVEDIKHSHILFILKENALIVALPTITPFHNELFDRLVQSLEKSKVRNISRLMYQFLLDDVNENYDVLDKVDTLITDLEKRILANKESARLEDVVKMKRRIHDMARRFWGSAKIIYVIRKGLGPVKPDIESLRLLDDVYDTYMHQVDILNSYKDMLSDMLMVNITKASNDLNIVIKRLTSFTVILLVPALIAGIYGMNFQYMPEISWQHGYPFALLFMLASIIVLMYAFHRKKWL